jgi:hypothetical protein
VHLQQDQQNQDCKGKLQQQRRQQMQEWGQQQQEIKNV